MLRFPARAALIVLWCLTACDRGSVPRLIGNPAPDFIVNDGERTVRLSEYRGHTVVLNFWASWCAPCIEETPSLLEMQHELRDKVVVLAVSTDADAEGYRRFLEEQKVDFLTVRDGEQKSNTLYGTTGFPETFIIDSHGIVRRKFIGPVEWAKPKMIEYLQQVG